MIEKVKSAVAIIAGATLVFFAEISTSTISLILWHEPDCPQELWK